MNLVRSPYSAPHILSVPDLIVAPAHESTYYMALFEFAQGSSPKIIWDNSLTVIPDRDSFLLYVVNASTDTRNSGYNPKPAIIKSEFCGIHYIAIYIQIPDVQARGFSRPIVLTIGHPNLSLISFIYAHELPTLLSFAESLQEAAAEIFPQELAVYAASLQSTIERFPDSKALLQSKVSELEYTLKSVGVDPAPKEKAVEVDVDFFTQINNDLRKIKKLTHFSDLLPSIENFISQLPSNQVQANAILRASPAIVGIATACRPCDTYKLGQLIGSRCFHDCLYTLLGKRNLYLVSQAPGAGRSLGNRLAALVPFGPPFRVVDIAERARPPEIILCSAFERGDDRDAGAFDLATESFDGLKCPPESILRSIAPRAEHSEQTLLAMVANEVRKLGARFLRKTVEMSARARQTAERMEAQMRTIGFEAGDAPIIRYWSELAQDLDGVNAESVTCFLE